MLLQEVCKVCCPYLDALREGAFRANGGEAMVLRIEESDLDNVLLAHKDAIGSLSVAHGVADAVAGVFYIVTAFSAEFPVVPLVVLAIIGLLFSCYGCQQWFRASRNRYTDRQLFEDIKRMDRTEVRSSLVAVKGCGEYFGNRFLLYHDDGWNCDFLPNRKTMDPAPDESKRLAAWLSEQYDIPCEDFAVSFITDADSKKECAEHDNQIRYYHYRLYCATVSRMPEKWCNPEFATSSGKQCRWMSVDEMFADERIRQVNGDVITAVRDYL